MTSPRRPDEPEPWRTEGGPGGGPPRRRPWWTRFAWLLLPLLAVNWILSSSLLAPEPRTPVSYTFLLTQAQSGNVADVTSIGDTIEGTFAEKAVYTPAGSSASEQVGRFTTRRPSFADDNLFALLQANGATVNASPPDAPAPLWQRLLAGFAPALLLAGLLIWLPRRLLTGTARGVGGFGRSRAGHRPRRTGARPTFADVAGIEEAVQEVTQIVDVLRDPDRYRRLGARIPHGVLLSGPPGTGKTLLARAVAGEAEVPFFSVSASGLRGAGPVRDLFAHARNVAPSIIFIDELDAAGRAGGAELNQILTEMDRFTADERVVVLAATNRPHVLDRALLRPGRFSRRVTVGLPGPAGRREILEVHTRGVPLGPDVRLPDIAAATTGMAGADLRHLVDEAALLAARRRHERVTAADLGDALEKIALDDVRGVMLTVEQKRRVAFHQSGHALLGMLTPGAGPAGTISLLPRGHAPGVPFPDPGRCGHSATYLPGHSATYLRGRVVGALGGRAAEEVVFGDVTTAADSDLHQVSVLARQLVGRRGRSAAAGPVSVLPPPGPDRVAPATRERVDAEARTVVDACYAEAVDLLRRHRTQLDRLAGRLLEAETLTGDDAYAAAGISPEIASGAVVLPRYPGADGG